MRPGRLLSFSFLMGWLTAISLILTVQDFLGKELYMQAIQNHWVDFGNGMWIVWLIVALASMSAHIYLKSIINAKSKEIEEEEGQ